ncbi:MAG: phenylacetate-CoA oxygenase subunit PaaC [Bacteroidetes bacterium]|nr:phenylacetate-CoA oxygenase subunit PaaC [Bacteroidota bacterium]MBS1629292.1 phenylacetate-CoA oxygenase subunit PaaC [Bacteroidota bacterium]
MTQEFKPTAAGLRLAYTLQLADNILILAHRLSEWCGHGPVLEQDIALTNTALDHLGGARSLYQYAAEQFNALPDAERTAFFTSPALQQALTAKGKAEEDDLAYLRDAWDFRNVLLAEQPNDDWAFTIARSFFMDAFHYFLYQSLKESPDETIAAVAEKSLKEVSYHLKWSSEWVIRLGDGTAESKEKMQTAFDERWPYAGEIFEASEADKAALAAGYGADLAIIKSLWQERVKSVLEEAGLNMPAETWMHRGGKECIHSEHLGYILAEMQFMQRAYPGMEW